MKTRLATKDDLPGLYRLFAGAVAELRRGKIFIWDDVYPACVLESDIESGGLYVMEENGELTAAFALCDINECEGSIDWIDNFARALFIYRLAVDTRYLHQGVGSLALREAAREAKLRGAEYLRLLVGDVNVPAVRLYEKNGFSLAKGTFKKVVSPEITLRELGYEIKT